jgi:hypothetical protein
VPFLHPALNERRSAPSSAREAVGQSLAELGIKVSQATVAKYIVRRVGTPSPTWRSFLRNEAIGIAAIDMFVAVPASFRLLYASRSTAWLEGWRPPPATP